MTITGTNHFASLADAIRYYADYGLSPDDVDRKISEGEIYLGKPSVGPGETLRLIDDGTRYAVVSPE